MNGDGGALVQCSNLVKIYQVADLEVVALQSLDLQVQRGEMLGIIGPSGSGKSTLLNILGGLDRPSAGAVTVNGRDLAKLTDAGLDRYRREVVGFVWQQPARNLTPYLTVAQNVGQPQTLAGRSLRWQRERTAELLDAVGLTRRRRHRLVELSGGEQQRVAIAVALANGPTILLGDEPTGELDSANADAIHELLRRLNSELGLTTIIVSHDPGIAARVDRVVAIRDGRTSTETVRRLVAGPTEISTAAEIDSLPAHHFDEYVLIDTAGRLQVPRVYLERLGIGERAELELREDGILIRPPDRAPRSDRAKPD